MDPKIEIIFLERVVHRLKPIPTGISRDVLNPQDLGHLRNLSSLFRILDA